MMNQEDRSENAKAQSSESLSHDTKKELQRSSYTRTQRLLATIRLVIMAGLIVALIVLFLTGAEPGAILAVLFCLIVIPCVLYGFRLYVDYTVRKDK